MLRVEVGFSETCVRPGLEVAQLPGSGQFHLNIGNAVCYLGENWPPLSDLCKA